MPSAVLVDDHDASLAFTASVVDGLGFEVAAYRHPDQALQQAAALRPALLLLDLNLPGLDGLELLRRLRDTWPADVTWPRVVGLSADELAPGRAGSELIDCFLRKPFSAAALRKAASPSSPAAPSSAREPGDDGLRRRFRAELRDGISHVDRALSRRRHDEAAFLLHRLAGASALLGEPLLRRRLQALMTACRSGADPIRIARLYCELRMTSECCLQSGAAPGREPTDP